MSNSMKNRINYLKINYFLYYEKRVMRNRWDVKRFDARRAAEKSKMKRTQSGVLSSSGMVETATMTVQWLDYRERSTNGQSAFQNLYPYR